MVESFGLRKGEERTHYVEHVDYVSLEIWSELLLIIDGWSLEKKISIEEAKVLRKRVWRRDRTILDTFMALKEHSEHEIISALLASSARRRYFSVIILAQCFKQNEI